MPQEYLHLWDEDVEILSTESVCIGDHYFILHHVHASDDTEALLTLCETEIQKDSCDMKSIVVELLRSQGLEPQFLRQKGDLYVASVAPIHSALAERFEGKDIGVVHIVDSNEPGGGSLALNRMEVHGGNVVQIIYRIASGTQLETKQLLS